VIEVSTENLPYLFKKRPVMVLARQFTNPDDVDLALWCEGELIRTVDEDGITTHSQIEIHTLEGTMTALVGDWIIRGVQGEHYPCKDAIFHQTYEQVVAC
jgi:hypothetical protein